MMKGHNQPVSVWKYIIIYAGIFLVIVAAFFLLIINLELEDVEGAIVVFLLVILGWILAFIGIIVAGFIFGKDHSRRPYPKEKRNFSLGPVSICIVMQVAILINNLFLVTKEKDIILFLAMLLQAVSLVIVSYFILYFSFGWGAKLGTSKNTNVAKIIE